MRRKIKLSTLEELSGVISHDEMVHYLGGGDGTRNHPFTFNEYKTWGYAFTQGWVVLPDGTLAYLTQNYFSYSGHTEIYYIGTTDYRLFSNTDYYYGSSPSSNTLEQALTGAGIGVGVEGFCMDLAQVVCGNNAARQSIKKAMEESLKASKIAGKFSRGCGAVGLFFSICGSSESITAVINGTGDTADRLNVASIAFGAVGVGCTAIGVTAPIGLLCGGISVTLSVVALVVDE